MNQYKNREEAIKGFLNEILGGMDFKVLYNPQDCPTPMESKTIDLNDLLNDAVLKAEGGDIQNSNFSSLMKAVLGQIKDKEKVDLSHKEKTETSKNNTNIPELNLNNDLYTMLKFKKSRGSLCTKVDFTKERVIKLLEDGISVDDICQLFNLSMETFKFVVDMWDIDLNTMKKDKTVKLLTKISFASTKEETYFIKLYELMKLAPNEVERKSLECYISESLQDVLFKHLEEVGVPEDKYLNYDGKLFTVMKNDKGCFIAIYDVYLNDYIEATEPIALEK